MSAANQLAAARREQSVEEIAAKLRAEWRMIAAVNLRPSVAGDGYEASLRFDPIIVKGAFEQRGYPRTSEAMVTVQARWHAAIEDCVRRVNEQLPKSRQIKRFKIES